MTTTVYLVGEPGAGKTTLMAELRAGWSELSLEKRPLKHVLWDTPDGRIVPELGWPRDGFGGTDALPMDAVRHAEPWIATCGYQLVLAEGDRLANSRFFMAAQAAGRLVLVHLHVPAELAEARRAERGSAQDPSWLAGRRTKVVNLVDQWSERADQLVLLDGQPPALAVADQLRAEVPELAVAA
jgi:hypothetical protein